MANSAFAVLFQQSLGTEASILFLRRSNGEWWLPGGKIITTDNSASQAVHRMVAEQLTFSSWHPGGIGQWTLSPEAGGHTVHLFEGYLTHPSKVKIRNVTSGLTQEMTFFTRRQIWNHLYEDGDIPWGQAKMAVYCLYDMYKHDRRADGELLKDDLGELHGLTWNRPE
jgi:hypothetical protein